MRDYGLLMRDLIPLPLEIPLRFFDSHYFLNLALLYRLVAHLNRAKKGEIHTIRVYCTSSSVSYWEAILQDFYFNDVIDIILHGSLLGVL